MMAGKFHERVILELVPIWNRGNVLGRLCCRKDHLANVIDANDRV